MIVGRALQIFSVAGIPEIVEGADLASVFADALAAGGIRSEAGDVFVVAQKVVSKAEGTIVNLGEVTPSDKAATWAKLYGKDAATVEVVFRESTRIVRMERGVIIAETRHGFICANAGVDSSNVPLGYVTLLPRDPDASAARLRDALTSRLGHTLGVIIADTFGRPWREGVVNVAIGIAGLQALDDWRGRSDRFGRRMHSTIVAVADEIASAAELVMGKTNGTPLAIVRGAAEWAGDGSAAALVRPAVMDMFR